MVIFAVISFISGVLLKPFDKCGLQGILLQV